MKTKIDFKQVAWPWRIGASFSGAWLGVVGWHAPSLEELEYQLVLFGLLPLLVVWGAVAGIRHLMRDTTAEKAPAEPLSPEVLRKAQLRTSTVVGVVLILGFVAANALMRHVPVRGDASLAYWSGQYMVVALLGYGVMRLITKWPYGFAAIAAAVLFVGGINLQAWKTSRAYSFETSIKKSAPFMNAMMNGEEVSDADIRAAKVGLMEPMLLIEAALSREMTAASKTFDAELTGLDMEEAFGPESLGTEAGRRTARGKIKASRETTREFLLVGREIITRGEERMRAALRKSSLPSESFLQGYLANVAKLSKYFDGLEQVGAQIATEQSALLTLLDQNTRHFALQHDASPHLVFDDDQVLASYRSHALKLQELGAQAMGLDKRLQDGVKQGQDKYNQFVETLK